MLEILERMWYQRKISLRFSRNSEMNNSERSKKSLKKSIVDDKPRTDYYMNVVITITRI